MCNIFSDTHWNGEINYEYLYLSAPSYCDWTSVCVLECNDSTDSVFANALKRRAACLVAITASTGRAYTNSYKITVIIINILCTIVTLHVRVQKSV